MPQVPIDTLPNTARVWIFAAERPLEAEEAKTLLGTTDAFLESWAAHGAPLTCGRDWSHDQFLLIAIDEAAAGVSGCSVDALVGSLRDLEQQLGIEMLNNQPVLYRASAGIARVSRPEFQALAEAARVTEETTVFDNTVTTLGAVREGLWETAAKNTWHARAFFSTRK
jgi:hypothetical protein